MIQKGNPGGMPPFEAVLSPQEVRAMVIYIREVGARARREKTTFNKPAANVVVTSEKATFRLETVAEGVTAPWGLDFLPDGRILVTEKAGKLRIIEKGQLLPEPVTGVPAVLDKGQGGLLDVAVHPDYRRNGWIYLSFSDPGENGSAMTKIVRGKLKGNAFVETAGRLQGAGRGLHRRPEPLRQPHRVRPQGAHLLQHRRARPGAARAGAEPPERQGAPDQRGRHHPEGQPVRRQAAGDGRRSTPTATATRRA